MTISRPSTTKARMLLAGTSPSRAMARNSATRLELDLGFENRDCLAADPHAGQCVVAVFQLNLDAPRAVQAVPLDAAEAGARGVALQNAQVREVGTEQPVCVAAHRVLRDAERRAEHA